jgi:predicted RNase H-like HicB family nuclease
MEHKFKVVVERGTDGYFVGEVPDLPGCYSQGKTVSELMENMKEAIEVYLETLESLNKKPENKFVDVIEVIVD